MSDIDTDEEAAPFVNPAARYEELLRPCRDLTANWNVDIVAKLSEYLAELDIDVDSLDSREFNCAQVNFQHAALVIEGGTCVYSRKVDYLYSLAFAAADMIFEARGKALPSNNAKAASAPGEDDEDGTPAAEEIEFLLLDDMLEKDQPAKEGITLPARNLSDIGQLQRARDANRLVSVPLHLLPPGPQQQRRQSYANQNTAGLRMPDATINVTTGALILDGIGIESGADMSAARASALNRSARCVTPRLATENSPGDSDDAFDCSAGDDFEGDIEGPSLSTPDNRDTDEHSLEPTLGSSVAFASKLAPHDGRPAVDSNQAGGTEAEEQDRPDPYEPLDPHDAMGFPTRPPRRGKTWSKPKMPSPAHKSDGDLDVSLSLYDRFLGKESERLARPTNHFVSFSAVEEQYKTRRRLLSAAKRRRTELLRRPRGRGRFAGGDISGKIGDPAVLNAIENLDGDIFANLNSSNEESGQVDAIHATDIDFGNDDVSEDDNGEAAEGFAGVEIPSLENLDGAKVDQVDDITNTDDVDRRVEMIAASYEESCRKYLLESSILWQEHAADTQLEQRVTDWRSRIEPLLCLEEDRPSFDIKLYGSSILQKFKELEPEDECAESDMGSLFAASETFEVCRSFLATLQLVNSYKIDIIPANGRGDDIFNPRVRLLERDRDLSFPKTPPRSKGSKHASNRTPSKVRSRILQERPQPLAELSSELAMSPSAKTPDRDPLGKRNRQAGSTPASARRAPSKLRIGGTPRKGPPAFV